jgi:hypothetical protein
MALERELETYRRELPRLLQHEGKFALVHGNDMADVYDTEEEAVEAGDDCFGLEPFLVKRIGRPEEPRFVPYLSGQEIKP